MNAKSPRNPQRRTALAACFGLLLTAGPASAFYFPGWPGSGVPPTRSLVPPTPPPQKPPQPPEPPEPPEPPDPPDPPDPPHAPEPATVFIGLSGLIAVAATRYRRRAKE